MLTLYQMIQSNLEMLTLRPIVQSNLEMFILGQDCPLSKLQVGASHHAFPSLVELEGNLICHSAALYKANIWRHLAEAAALVETFAS